MAFNPKEAFMCMQASALAYIHNIDVIKTKFPSITDAKFLTNPKTGTEVLLIDWGDVAIAAFRGTQVESHTSLIDILRNTKFIKKTFQAARFRCRAHRGYAEGVNSVVAGVDFWVRDMQKKGKKVLGTGHSMGGVEITGCASIVDFDAVYTFGAPRFGDRKFAKEMQGKVFRIVLDEDIAPSWPHYLLGYRHTAPRYQLTEEGLYRKGKRFGKDFWHFPYIEGKDDHRPAKYVRATRQAARRKDHQL